MNNFTPFDPLKAKTTADTEVAALAQKREINNILGSYVGWFDPFCELIQNSLDAVEEREKLEESGYVPNVFITVNMHDNSLTVTDNGIGLEQEKFTKFLCPDISFKSGKTRGSKGVGATYLAYGFNFIQVASKTPTFLAVGKMENARNWLDDENPSGNPQVKPDTGGVQDTNFDNLDRGVSIHVKFDKTTHPKDLKWIVSDKAEQWFKILSIRTGLGAIFAKSNVNVTIKIISKDGTETTFKNTGIEYYWPHKAVVKSSTIKKIQDKQTELFQKRGANFTLPDSLTNLDAFYERYTYKQLLDLNATGQIKLENDEIEIITKYEPEIYACFVYSVKIWDAINQELNVRGNVKVLYGGIQIASNNMPQGETIQIPLNRNTGRQNQIHILIHFQNCNPDLGRKGYRSEVVDFAKEISKKISDGPLLKIKSTLRANTGSAPNLKRQQMVDDWKKEMIEYETNNPLNLSNENFFHPLKKISILSKPSREQDVIALFNQLLSGGVIRGIQIMSTNERLTYDGLYRVKLGPPENNHIYDKKNNPLGLDISVVRDFKIPFNSDPKVLEYKYSLDGLIEDIESGVKNSNDISLAVVWVTGELYKENYKITSLLDPNNLSLREIHGVTHTVTNIETGQREMELIVLSELIDFLNDQETVIAQQIQKYED